jgi:mannose-6-phosphate isomerase
MSFMFTPHEYDDPTAINRPALSDETISSIISGTKEAAGYLSNLITEKVTDKPNLVVALDGYIGAQFDATVNLISQQLKLKGIAVKVIDFTETYKSSAELDALFLNNLETNREKDPVLLFGKLYKGGYEDILDNEILAVVQKELMQQKSVSSSGTVTLVFGCGCVIKSLRSFYDLILFFDITPKKAILRAKSGLYANLGDQIARPIKELLRRCYYIDFELAGHLRWELLKNNLIDFYFASDDPEQVKLIPIKSMNEILSSLAKCPMRCRPVYIEGVWGGQYIKKWRNLPETMRNCAWVFDLIPLEVSIVVEAGKNLIDFPFFTFVQKEGNSLMGGHCVEKFGGYFPIRFNYDDTYHSSGNMSIQVHSGHDYNVENYGEYGRQDESYYIVATGHGAKTYVGFNENVETKQFIEEAKQSEKLFTPIDYEKYISHVESLPGIQVMLPAGTIHASGRNQVILEIGSLTIGSYTYKIYDYLRSDLDGIPRPIHIYHGERVVCQERTTSWVKDNIVQAPQLVRKGEGWAEYIVGEHNLLYFSLRRLEFEKYIEDDTAGEFHVLTLVDGEKVVVESIDHPEYNYTQNYLDVIIVPANVGRYRIRNLGNQPVCVHKTRLKDGYTEDNASSISGN